MLTSASASRRQSNTSAFPNDEAIIRGVIPDISVVLGSMLNSMMCCITDPTSPSVQEINKSIT